MIKIVEVFIYALVRIFAGIPLEFVAWGQANPVKATGSVLAFIIILSVVSTVFSRD